MESSSFKNSSKPSKEPLGINCDRREKCSIAPLVTVFQASPLGCPLTDGVTHRIEQLNLKLEREILSNIFQVHKAAIDFRIATIDGIGEFLLQKHQVQHQQSVTCRALHFSGHGHKQYLAVEDAWGGMVCLWVDVLRHWMAQTTALDFVFIAACHSRSIGEALVEAGVKHVICAVGDDTEVVMAYSVEFSKVLYRAMLSGSSVQEAFDMAKLVTGAHGCFKAQQFCLLPEADVDTGIKNDHHCVYLFAKKDIATIHPYRPPPPPFACDDHKTSSTNETYLKRAGAVVPAIRYNGKPYDSNAGLKSKHTTARSFTPDPGTISPLSNPCKLSPERTPPRNNLTRIRRENHETSSEVARLQQKHGHPKPPEYFVRHDVEMYRIVRAVGVARIIWITGAKGCGKSTVVRASCSYLQDRMALNELEGIFWSESLGEGTAESLQSDNTLQSLLQAMRAIPSRRFLIVIDARRLPDKTGQELTDMLQLLVQESPLVKILVIHQTDDSAKLQMGTFQCIEHNIGVDKLNLESTVKLFATFSQHVFNHLSPGISCPKSLWEHMAPPSVTDGNFKCHHTHQYDTRGWTGGRSYTSASSSLVSELPKRHEVVFKLLGQGFPREVIRVAKEMSAEEFTKVVFLGGFKQLDGKDYQFHNGLLRLQLNVCRALVSSIRKQSYDQATRLQLKFDCISMVKQEIRSLRSLRDDLIEMQAQISAARKAKDMAKVMDLFRRQQGVWKQLRGEVDALIKSHAPVDVSNPDDLEMCCNRESSMETVLLRVQDTLAEALTHPRVYSSDERPKDSSSNTTTADSMLLGAEKLLIKSTTEKFSPSDIPMHVVRASSPRSFLSDYLAQKVGNRFPPSGLTKSSGAESEVTTKDELRPRLEAATLLQSMVRRHIAKRKVEKMRIDFMETKRCKSQKKERSRAKAGALLRSVQEEKQNLDELVDTNITAMLVQEKRCPPVRSTKDNQRSHLQAFFGKVLSHGEPHYIGQSRPTEKPILTKRERTHLCLRQARTALRSSRVSNSQSTKKKSVQTNQQPRKISKKTSGHSRQLSNHTATTAGSTITVNSSIASSAFSPCRRVHESSRGRKRSNTPPTQWTSPLLSPSESGQPSASIHRHRPSSTSNGTGQHPTSILLSSSFSSSADLSYSTVASTVHSSSRTVRFVESQSSIDSTASFWNVGNDDDDVSVQFKASHRWRGPVSVSVVSTTDKKNLGTAVATLPPPTPTASPPTVSPPTASPPTASPPPLKSFSWWKLDTQHVEVETCIAGLDAFHDNATLPETQDPRWDPSCHDSDLELPKLPPSATVPADPIDTANASASTTQKKFTFVVGPIDWDSIR